MATKLKETAWSKALEADRYNKWKDSGIYAFKKKRGQKVFSIDTPPPYVNTPIHIGQLTTYVLMDMFARYHRMVGDAVLFPLGLDKNGLPIEMAAEKEFKVKLNSIPRGKALELCKKILEKASTASINYFLRCGISFNSWNEGDKIGDAYSTDSPDYRALTQETFIRLWNKGLIYEDKRISNWCPGCQTTLADAEIEYELKETDFNDIVFTVKESGEKIIVGTTRPELICTCAMVIYNPEDKRYSHLEGKTAITPIFNKEVPIKAHPLADPTKGTGLVMMCSAGDLSDIRFFREMGLKPVIAINKDGTMNEHAQFLAGLPVDVARKAMIERLKGEGLLVKQRKILHRSPVCERSKDPIEFIEMEEFYLKQVEYKSRMEKIAHALRFFSPESRQLLLDWIKSVSLDWPISRRRYYATEIPLWQCTGCGYRVVPPIEKRPRYYQPWKEGPPIDACPKCKGKSFKGEERVLDTWFDSSNSPLYILKWSRAQDFFEKAAPCSLRPQGKEIVRTWLYYTLLKCYLLTGKPIFRDVWINYHVVDESGKKMSKSAGNVIEPKEVLDRFGAEPFRLWAAVEGNLEKGDFRCNFERIEAAGKTLTKLWNIARFISMFELPELKSKREKPKLRELDKWILFELNELVKLANERYQNYDFHQPVIAIRHFIWETFASNYLELVKGRAYNSNQSWSIAEQAGAIQTLNHCLETLLKLLAPVIPMITSTIYERLTGKEIHTEKFPKAKILAKPALATKDLLSVNSAIWKAKKEKGLSLKSSVKLAVFPESLAPAEKELQQTHNITEIRFGKELRIVL
ncbi:MAG: valine--tRNA ligase [Candidatus Woesearchaeota archaeon]